MKRADRPPAAARLAEIEETEVTIEKLIAGGEGLGRFEGIPLFVPRSAPGDRLRVQIVERHADYGRAEILQILTPGPGRRESPCPYFARCGGCDLQHLEDDLQPRLKADAARETIERMAKLELPPVELVTGEPWSYRLRTQLHVEPAAGLHVEPAAGLHVEPAPANETSGFAVGYRARRSHELVAIERCPILVPELETELPGLGDRLPPETPRRLDLAAGDGGALTVSPPVEGLPSGEVSIEAGGMVYTFDARCFFQAHRGLLARLVETVVGEDEGETAFDLYAGVGLFALPLARRYRRVTAVEGDRLAARFARNNARQNRLGNVQVVGQAIETWARLLPGGVDRVVVDPPRSGLSPAVRKVLRQRKPRRLTYVSCHAATLARDLRELAEVYRLDKLTFLDLFPQTGHLETVAQLERSA